MIRISRMADYGVVALSFMAREPDALFSAASIAERTGVPLPSASKLLKLLVKSVPCQNHQASVSDQTIQQTGRKTWLKMVVPD